ncbi:Endo-1,4-beta-xylanase 2 [Metarhizium acridum]|nr:Endo-1,4-beta-xylanase 2 [Metarhizium acridum]
MTRPSCVLYGPGKVRFEDRPLPVIDDAHHVLVRIAYVGVCGTDVRFWTHGGMIRTVSEERPLVMGHEASGVVHAVGAAVNRVQPGDQVVIEPGFPCHKCKLCPHGRYNLCPSIKFAADPPQDGTLSYLYRVAEQFVFKIPSFLSLQEAVLVEPLSVVVHGARLAPLEPACSVLVQGSGVLASSQRQPRMPLGQGQSSLLILINKSLTLPRASYSVNIYSGLCVYTRDERSKVQNRDEAN